MNLTPKYQFDCVTLSEAIYKDKREYEIIAKERGYPHTKFFDKADTQVAISYYDRTTIIVFRGTELFSWGDIWTNLRAIRYEWAGTGEVHGGYDSKVNAVFPKIQQHLKRRPTANLIITGHSLGGALATICAARMEAISYMVNPDYLITFGSPTVGNEEFANSLRGESVRFDNRGDPVPTVPLSGTHVKGVVKLNSGLWLPLQRHRINNYKNGLQDMLLKP